MDIRNITPNYAVSPQLDPADFARLASDGFKLIIANRPDNEVPPSHQADAMEAAATEAGLAFLRLPLTHETMTPENVALQAEAITSAEGKVLAYCASGTRSTVVWAIGQARLGASPDDVLAAARAGGYQLDHLRPALQALCEDARG